MSFLPAIPLSFVMKGYGRIFVNIDGTLIASTALDYYKGCVYIYSVDKDGECISDPVRFPNSADIEISSSLRVCFVRRNDVDTLLISDIDHQRIFEITTQGVLLRVIPVDGCYINGLAYSDKDGGMIAVSAINSTAFKVLLLQYESGAMTPVTGVVGENIHRGVTFTADGNFLMLIDYANYRVSKFSASTGEFITHLVSSGISYPMEMEMLQFDDGSLLVTQGDASIVHVVDGVVVERIVFRNDTKQVLQPFSLCYSQLFAGVVVGCSDGSLFILRDAWVHGSRCAWLGAACIE